MGTEDGAEVKVGYTRQATHVRRRQHEISNGRAEPLRTLAVVIGSPADEKALKRYFKDYTSREHSVEWIHAGALMRDYLRFLRDLPFVARSDDADELRRLEPADAEQWLPGEGRRKGAAQLRLAEDDPWADLYAPEPGGGDFYTSPRFIEPARKCMGSIDLDPASCREANDVVKATRFYGQRDNGLLHEWAGNVWLNPPFGLWSNGWAPKVMEELRSGRVTQLCLLLSSRSCTDKAVHPLIQTCDALLLTFGRIPFWGPKATSSPDDGHLVLYFGAHPMRFADAFRHIGAVKFQDSLRYEEMSA